MDITDDLATEARASVSEDDRPVTIWGMMVVVLAFIFALSVTVPLAAFLIRLSFSVSAYFWSWATF